MHMRLCLAILIVLSAVAVVWAIAEQRPIGRDLDGDAAERAGLLERIRECERQIAEQRQIIRKHTLDSTSRSVDELFALFPAKYPQGNWKPADVTFEDCWFWSADGLRLHGWYYRHPRLRAVLLFIHGNAGNLSFRAPVVKLLHDRFTLSVLIFDYRGYRRSEGIPTLRDARAARHKLAEREGIAEKDVVLLGESLGGAVAVDLASEDGAKAIILESTFSSLSDAAAEHYSEALANVLTADKLDSASKIKNYMGPLLQCHGDRDRTIPYDLGRKLFAAANEPKTFVTLPGKNHNDAKTEGYYRLRRHF